MKTKPFIALLFVIVISLMINNANAQYRSFYLGLKAAPQICWMKANSDGYSGNGLQTGFSWGFISEFNFTENHSFATGFNILFNGGGIKFPDVKKGDTTHSMVSSYYLKYVEVPLSIKMRTNPIKGVRYFGHIGLGTAFKISTRKSDKISSNIDPEVDIPKSTYELAFVRESLIVGLGGEYEIKGGTKLGLELAFNNGFTNIMKKDDPKAMPNFIELAVSILF